MNGSSGMGGRRGRISRVGREKGGDCAHLTGGGMVLRGIKVQQYFRHFSFQTTVFDCGFVSLMSATTIGVNPISPLVSIIFYTGVPFSILIKFSGDNLFKITIKVILPM